MVVMIVKKSLEVTTASRGIFSLLEWTRTPHTWGGKAKNNKTDFMGIHAMTGGYSVCHGATYH